MDKKETKKVTTNNKVIDEIITVAKKTVKKIVPTINIKKEPKVDKKSDEENYVSNPELLDDKTREEIKKEKFEALKKSVEQAKIGKLKFSSGLGRRKTSVARVWLFDEPGEIMVNGTLVDDLYVDSNARNTWVKPFHAVGVSHPKAKFSASIKVEGGGLTGQIDAIQLAITRALVDFDKENKSQLKKNELTTRDSRMVERKKTSQPKARKKRQFSKR